MAHYNKADFVAGLRKVGLGRGDIVFGHSNIGFFGVPEEGRSVDVAFEVILEAFREVLGDEGTIVAPAFTYSFPQGEVFDVDDSPGIGGVFAEKLRALPDSVRSQDPAVSVVALGRQAEALTGDQPSNSYDPDAFFGRLLQYEAKVCNMNFDAASTFVHFAERECQVPYRFDKTFQGTIRERGLERPAENTIWVRYLHDELVAVFEPFDRLAVDNGLCQVANVGRGFVKAMTIRDQFNLVCDTLKSDPWFLTQAGVSGNVPHIDPATMR